MYVQQYCAICILFLVMITIIHIDVTPTVHNNHQVVFDVRHQ